MKPVFANGEAIYKFIETGNASLYPSAAAGAEPDCAIRHVHDTVISWASGDE